MFDRLHNSLSGLYARLVVVAILIVAAVCAGLWLGEKSVRFDEPSEPASIQTATPASVDRPPDVPSPPLFFFVGFPAGGERNAAVEEIGMAAAADVHQYVLSTPLPWQGDMNAFLEPVNAVLQSDPRAALYLYVTLDPPPPWLAAHPDEAARSDGKESSYASLASEVWRRDAHSALEALVSGVKASTPPGAVRGYVIGCLESGRWYRTGGYDASAPNTAAFRQWLTARYKDTAMLQRAWGDADVTLDSAAVPEKPDTAAGCPIFFETSSMQRQIDFLQYTSESAAETIAAFAGYVKQSAGKDIQALAAYGYTFELAANSGHFALSRLLDGDLDGFVSPISYYDRGLGGTGGVMGPVDTVLEHHKQWWLIDDTRTGIARDPASGELARPKNVRAEDVYWVQQRNFAAAVCRGLGLLWADPSGDGVLHDAEMWRRFGNMGRVYQDVLVRGQADAGQAPYPSKPILAVVVDEVSRCYQQCDTKLNEVLLNQVRDAALRAGVITKFYLLRDVIDQRVAAASAYLFLNAFHLSAEDRARLHAVLQQNRAAAIWMYAPGYIDATPSVDNISATTRIQAKAFDDAAQAGSFSLLPGRWVGKDEELGAELEMKPLFYIDDPDVDVLAKYRVSGKPSVAIRFFEEGWASIYCAEPSLTNTLLREILSILELHLCYQATPTKFYDATYLGSNLLAIHAKETGERVVDLDRICDIRDVLTPEIGWPRKRVFTVPLKTGETRLLRLTPVEAE